MISEALEFAHLFLSVVWNVVKSVARCLAPSFMLGSKSVDGQVALVTGGGSGIGRQLAIRLADLGVQVVIWDVNLQGAEETCSTIRHKGQSATAYFCDISDRTEVYRVAKLVKTQVGKVDILVNNAGVAMAKKFDKLSDATIEKVYGINILAHYWTCKAFLPDMVRDDRGHILAVASVAGFMTGPNLTDYSPTKHAVCAFMQCLRTELIMQGSRGVHVTTACPYFVKTTLYSASLPFWITCYEPEDCARDIVDGMLRNKDMVVVPAYMGILRGLHNVMSPGFTASVVARTTISTTLGTFKTDGLSQVQAFKEAAKKTITE